MTNFEWVLTGCFVLSSVLIIYHHVGYPILLKQLAKRVHLHDKELVSECSRFSVTMVIPAYNEAPWIANKIRNCAMLDYPSKQLRVLVVCDGCTDNTADIARATIQEAICANTHFEIIEHNQNQGKVAIINQTMKMVNSDITILSDVSALVSIDALRLVASRFNTQEVGVVNGCYSILNPATQGEAEYWKYQSKVKVAEADLATSIGSHGAFYAIRTELFSPLAKHTINDDFIIPMRIVEQGFQAEYEPSVIATEMEPSPIAMDFKRRLRISAGNMQQLLSLSKLLHPKFKLVAFAFASGKGLRLLIPYLMMLALFSSTALAHYALFFGLLVAQLLFYAVAILGSLIPHQWKPKLIELISYFFLGHLANLLGGLSYLATLPSLNRH